MIDLVKLVYNQTFKLLESTFKKRASISQADFDTIIDDYTRMFKIVNNTVTSDYIDPNMRANKIIEMNDDVVRLSEAVRLKIKKNPENYIVDNEISKKENNTTNQIKSSNKNHEIIGDNDDDLVLRDESQKTSELEINQSAIIFLINDSSNEK